MEKANKDYLSFQHEKYYNKIKKLHTVATVSFHQGDLCIFSPISAGKQYVANSIMAIIHSCVLSVEHWQSEHLDFILVT